ncbi:Uncharacterized membrane protein [Fontimonas thermophila]|uniref:Uncharacterized membrane protein n=1 Tax=Fontimonas thermophila TaxID=1076937 RepID=A0A1I2K045_9GAMM|nr:DUF819 family protein [Fontimonas thermophila]SFF59658.1 Uncharacterized membrane protein [Fontimonas thermophila]
MKPEPLITNDAVTLGLLSALLGVVFYTAHSAHPFWRRFYAYVPALLLCYFLPALFNSLGVIDGEHSQLYVVASRYLLPATLVLLTLSIDLPAILRLGPKALALFLTGTLGVIVGGPLALLIWQSLAPGVVAGEVWRGMATVAGSWIGGSANQAAMKEVFAVDNNLFGMMVAVDVIVANLWMAVLLYLAGRSQTLDARRGVDTSALQALRTRMERFEAEHARIPQLPDLIFMLALAFGATGLAHALATPLAAFFDAQGAWAQRLSLASPFFWIVVLATSFGLLLSFTGARRLEGAGASKIGSALLYVLIASIGMHMDLRAILTNPGLFGVGLTWIAIHAALLIAVARLLKAPVFYLAIGSQANIGGAASAPVVASAFHPSLAPVGVLLAVLGYALGTYGGWVCGQLLRLVAE